MKKGMTCRDGVRVLMDYIEGELSTARRRAVEGHVTDCRRCRRFVRSYRETPRILREATDSVLSATSRGRLRRMIRSLPPRY